MDKIWDVGNKIISLATYLRVVSKNLPDGDIGVEENECNVIQKDTMELSKTKLGGERQREGSTIETIRNKPVVNSAFQCSL